MISIIMIVFVVTMQTQKVEPYVYNVDLGNFAFEPVANDISYRTEFEKLPYSSYTLTSYEVGLFSTSINQIGEQGIIENIYSSTSEELVKRTVLKEPIDEIIYYGLGNPVSFTGNMTGYGPDCVGCTGYTACAPHPNVTNTTKFKDVEYGIIRVVAADKNVPCGTIMEVSGYKIFNTTTMFHENAKIFTVIVLDRGSAIVGKTTDLLYETEGYGNHALGRQHNVTYTIKRWGW